MKKPPKKPDKFVKGGGAVPKPGDILCPQKSDSDHSMDSGFSSSKSSEDIVRTQVITRQAPPVIPRFNLDELRKALLPVWKTLDSMEESAPFRVPIDPIAMGIPDYLDIIKRPMDLATIRRKLDLNGYKTPREFCDDFWLMFNNSWTYNKKTLKVYKFTTKLSQVFLENMDPIMKSYGYCCADQHQFSPLVLICNSEKSCVIKRNEEYYVYERKVGQKIESFYYCYQCFEKLPDEKINLASIDEQDKRLVGKEEFIMLTNNKIDVEPLETCRFCGKDWHNACAMFNVDIYKTKFVCPSCKKKKRIPKLINKFKAENLPRCHLAGFLEMRVIDFLRSQLHSGVNVTIRMLNNQEKHAELKPLMKEHFEKLKKEGKIPEDTYSEKFFHRTKCIFAFQEIDDEEVCFFGMFVHEYDHTSPLPNWRRVYISYLDSVHYFQPKELRSMIYHEILLGYLDYVRRRGYLWAHIWSCPPNEGDDYIFNVHPPEQKTPSQERLIKWYLNLIEKGKKEAIIYYGNNILEQAKEDEVECLTQLPYFRGDLWPNIIEEILKQYNMENDENVPEIKCEKSKSKKSIEPPRKKRKRSHVKYSIMDLLYQKLEKHQNEYLIIRLNGNPLLEDIIDKNPIIENDLFDGRDSFLIKSKNEHMEFSSLRRTKYSTMKLCYLAHVPECHCNICKNTALWHCDICDDYDLCHNCWRNKGHQHDMKRIRVKIFFKLPYQILQKLNL